MSEYDEQKIREYALNYLPEHMRASAWFDATVRQLLEQLSRERKKRPDLSVEEFLQPLRTRMPRWTM